MPGRRQTPLSELTMVSGAIVRQRREQTGTSGRDVARDAGVSHSMLARWEQGVRDPPLTHAVAIARVLGLRLDELVEGPPSRLWGIGTGVDLELLMGEEFIGYRETKQHEAFIARRTVSEHEGLVRLWLRALEQYHVGAKGERILTDSVEDQRIARMVRAQFSELAEKHLQSALEDTLAGKYHHAGFSFRYVAELLIQALYVRLRPEEARRWYPGLAKPGVSCYPPHLTKTAWKVVREHLSRPDGDSLRPMVELIHSIVKEMDDHGAHPSQATLQQLLDWQGDSIRIGLRYDDNHAIVHLHRGVTLTLFLLYEMETLLPEDEWMAQVRLFWDERRALMEPLRARFEESEARSAPAL